MLFITVHGLPKELIAKGNLEVLREAISINLSKLNALPVKREDIYVYFCIELSSSAPLPVFIHGILDAMAGSDMLDRIAATAAWLVEDWLQNKYRVIARVYPTAEWIGSYPKHDSDLYLRRRGI